jgi:tellurite resistance protein
VPQQEQQDGTIGQDWILRAMIAMAGADGRLDTREVGLIQQIYQDLTGKALTAPEIADAAKAYALDGNLLAELSVAADGLDLDTKEEVIRAAYLILLADDHIAGQERKKLQDVAAAMKVPEIHFGAILEDLAVWLTSLKR